MGNIVAFLALRRDCLQWEGARNYGRKDVKSENFCNRRKPGKIGADPEIFEQQKRCTKQGR